MIDRPRDGVPVAGIRLDRDEIGAGTAILDDDTLVVVEDAATEPRSLRVPLESIDSIRTTDAWLELTFVDGARLAILCPQPDALAAQLRAHLRRLPELTRTLRALGSRRRGSHSRATFAGEQRRFFAPLLEARRRALDAPPDDVISAFDAGHLTKAFTRTLEQFAADRYAESGPARRALEAELEDAAEALFAALAALGTAATPAARSSDDVRAWREWTAQLRATYEAADRVWVALGPVLDAPAWPE